MITIVFLRVVHLKREEVKAQSKITDIEEILFRLILVTDIHSSMFQQIELLLYCCCYFYYLVCHNILFDAKIKRKRINTKLSINK